MQNVTFITGNQGKYLIARDIFQARGLSLSQKDMDTPEIQSLDVLEVAGFAATHAAKATGQAVLKSDVGYYIPALGGFPGPLVKFINQTLKPEDILALMQGKPDRTIFLREALAFVANPESPPRTFFTEQKATLALEPMGSGSPFDQLLILEGFDKPKGACAPEEVFEHWKKTLHLYDEAACAILKDRI